MNLDIIREKLLSSATKKAEEILKQASYEVEQEDAAFTKQLEIEFEKRLNEEKAKIDLEFEKLKIIKLMQHEKERLSKKREIIDKLFAKLKEEILFDTDNYLKLLLNLIKKDAVDNAVIFLNEHDLKAFSDIIKKQLSTELKDKHMSLSNTPADIDGGCIIKTAEFEIDDTLGSILESFRDKYEIEIAKEIFK